MLPWPPDLPSPPYLPKGAKGGGSGGQLANRIMAVCGVERLKARRALRLPSNNPELELDNFKEAVGIVETETSIVAPRWRVLGQRRIMIDFAAPVAGPRPKQSNARQTEAYSPKYFSAIWMPSSYIFWYSG